MKTDQTGLDALMARNPDLARRNRQPVSSRQPTPERPAPINQDGDDQAEKLIQDMIEAYFRQLNLQYVRAPMHTRSMLPEHWPDFTVGIPSPTGPQAWGFEVKTVAGKKRNGEHERKQKAKQEAMKKSGGWHVAVVTSLAEVQTIVEDTMWGSKIVRTKIER